MFDHVPIVMINTFEYVLLLLISSIIGVVIFQSLNLPSILGYLAVGFFVGPNAMNFTRVYAVEALAEFGIVFLMFSLGLEFSIRKLKTMGRAVFGLGCAQVIGSLLFTMLAVLVLKPWISITWTTTFILGNTLALSSTAIVIKMLKERVEADSEHGKNIIGILIFQDLAVVPLIIVISALGAKSNNIPLALAAALGKICISLVVLLILGKKIFSYLLTKVSHQKSPELFISSLLLITLGAAYLSEQLKLSMPFGAFIAGILIAETPFQAQVEEAIQAFRDILLGLFFIVTGMMLDPKIILSHPILVLGFFIIPIIFKLCFITFIARLFGASKEGAIKTGLYLAQAGEFGFVVLQLSLKYTLIKHDIADAVLAASLLSMIIGPFLIQNANFLIKKLSPWISKYLSFQQDTYAIRTYFQRKNKDHIIICGYDEFGRDLERLGKQEGYNILAIHMDMDRTYANSQHNNIKQTSTHPTPINKQEVLKNAGIECASALVITSRDEQIATKILCSAREINKTIPIFVRALNENAMHKFLELGASQVVLEMSEKSFVLASQLFLFLKKNIKNDTQNN